MKKLSLKSVKYAILSIGILFTNISYAAEAKPKSRITVTTIKQIEGTIGTTENCTQCEATHTEAGLINVDVFKCPNCTKLYHTACLAQHGLEYIIQLYKNYPANIKINNLDFDPHNTTLQNHILYNMLLAYPQNAENLHKQATKLTLPCCNAEVSNDQNLLNIIVEYWQTSFDESETEREKSYKAHKPKLTFKYLINDMPDENQFKQSSDTCTLS